MNKLTDKFIWKSLKDGDLKAFSVLFETYYPLLHNYGLKISKNIAVTEDSLQDFFIYIYEKRENLSDLETIAPYLFTSYRRFLLNIMKKNAKLKYVDFSEETITDIEFTKEELMTNQEAESFRNKNLSKLLNKLPARQKEAVYLKYYTGLKAREIAEIMNINYQSVVNTLHKAIKNLKEEVSILKLFK
ncbi:MULTISPECIES: RNA polymerase sigma factor [Tenacibaculum]|uniref:RNA polymerase sigma factor n=1 Tax=Tenacibaculum TaxID=104267 RepID=UPI001F0AC2BB|nr:MULTISPECIES: sigma-70 family RNA polymerase sigma factor [Tenacibaculum]MCH3882141.1 sigma-70 family RNA polymerase sigma factor [Tenacibaculum aquimarinum]MCH3885156.1 sigma-70 family RNA polymerase sigma factor [Tenacibaculum aquimarinum]MDO6599781.1 sigma-70 family RNA polymerase sigma factor [Tenacibaculum sp. 1_MG-2023]